MSSSWGGRVGNAMTLPLKDRLTMRLMPSSFYYRRRLADEARWGEHELDLLGEIVSPGGIAIDVGANQGVFAFAFSKIVDQVEAFEPNLTTPTLRDGCLGPAREFTRSPSRTKGVVQNLSSRFQSKELLYTWLAI